MRSLRAKAGDAMGTILVVEIVVLSGFRPGRGAHDALAVGISGVDGGLDPRLFGGGSILD